jgi:hypothetical protein
MYYKKIKTIARLTFAGTDSVETVQPYPVLSFNLANLTNIPITDNSYLVLECISFEGLVGHTIRCDKLSSRLIYWDSTYGTRADPIILSIKSLNDTENILINPDPTNLFKFPIDKTFFNNPTIKFSFDTAIATTANKNKLVMSFIIYDEEDVWVDTPTEVKKDDYINGKRFPAVY